jgi:hypothetical protein
MNEEYDKSRNISIDFEIKMCQENDSNLISCYIPFADIYFSAKSLEDVDKKGILMIKSFINFWNKYSNGVKKDSIKGEGPMA